MDQSLHQRLLRSVQALSGSLLDLLLPQTCILCSERSTDKPGICDPCRSALTTDRHNTCPCCATTIGPHTLTQKGCPWCRREKYCFQEAMRLGSYQGQLKKAVLLLKSPRYSILAREIARIWVERDRELFQKHQLDRIIPIPSHWIRWWIRGANPMDAVGKELARLLEVPFHPGGLLRIRNTSRQVGINVNRRENVSNAFAVPKNQRFDGQKLLLLDDVFTTGATANEASRPLLEAGAAWVVVAMLARTPVST